MSWKVQFDGPSRRLTKSRPSLCIYSVCVSISIVLIYNVSYSHHTLESPIKDGSQTDGVKGLAAEPGNPNVILDPTWWKERTGSHKLIFDLL